MIKTTKFMRKNYEKHMTMLQDVADGELPDAKNCYMCKAVHGDCERCPMNYLLADTPCYRRHHQLRTEEGYTTNKYSRATPKSIIDRANYICGLIDKHTDCKMY